MSEYEDVEIAELLDRDDTDPETLELDLKLEIEEIANYYTLNH